MSTSPEPGTPAPDPAANTPAPEPAPTPPLPEPAPSMPPATLEQLLPTARALVAGLAWGALMLIVLGFWIRSKNDPATRFLTTVFLVGGGISLGLAVWQAFTLWFKQEDAASKAATLDQQRRILGNILLLGGLALIGFAFFLGVGKKPGGEIGFLFDNLAESIGALIFGLIALGSGYLLTLPSQTEEASPMRSLAGKTPMLKLLQMVIGVVAITGFCVIAYKYRTAFTGWIPELAALLFLSILCFACLIWLNTGQFNEVGMRVFTLVFGGSLGCILFLYALARAYLWRDVFLGGIAAWQSATGWHGWLVLYLQAIALILMFVSFNLARADIRTNATLRRVMFGYDTLLQGLLLFEILVILNFIVHTLAPFTYDWTATRGVHALAPATTTLVSGLKKEINVVVLMRQGNPIYKDLHNLLDNCQALNSTKFHVTYLSPESNLLQFENLTKVFPKISPEPGALSSGVLIVNGPIPDKEDEAEKVAYSFVPDRKLHDMERPRGGGERAKLIFKGEAEILKEVKFLVQDKKKNKIYILQGDDEPDVNIKDDRDRTDVRDTFAAVGIGSLVDRLQLDNYEVSGLSFGKDLGLKTPNVVFLKDEGPEKKKTIPADCSTLILAGASRKLPPEAIDAIETYMNRGGKMLAFFDVIVEPDFSKMKESGLEEVLRHYGVNVTDEFALRFPRHQFDDARAVFAFPSRKTDNPLAREFSRPIVMKKSARVIKPAEGPGAQRFRADTILQLDLRQGERLYYTVEKKTSVLANAQKYMIGIRKDDAKLDRALAREPIPVAVAVSEVGGKDNDKPRVVVFGDTEFITNRDLDATGYSLVSSSIEWMGERESIGAQPKTSPSFSLPPEVNFARMIFLPGWIMLLCLICLGIGVWIVRRR